MRQTGTVEPAAAAQHGRELRPVPADAGRPRVVVLLPRGEAVRNFVYTGVVRELNQTASVVLLSVTQDETTLGPFAGDVDDIEPLPFAPHGRALQGLLNFIDLAHYRTLGTVVAQEVWERRSEERLTGAAKWRRALTDVVAQCVGNRPALERLTNASQFLAGRGKASETFVELFRRLRPALVFNGSHIHSPASSRPLAVAQRMGIPTAGFIFSWDNITSRGRIKEHYDHYLVWHQRMRDELLKHYPRVDPGRVVITGTPQFDFHFKPEFVMSRADICRQMGLDPARPFVLYTTGVASHFPEEHRTVEFVARVLQGMNPAPQLLVRTYIKGTSAEMWAIRDRQLPGVVFPPLFWKTDAFTPMYEDISVYNSLLRHCCFGINVASTVSLELMMYDKPVINLGFDPPGSNLGRFAKFERHLRFDHYRPVAESGAVRVARSTDDLESMIHEAMENPAALAEHRKRFLRETFGTTLDGQSGSRVAESLLRIVNRQGIS